MKKEKHIKRIISTVSNFFMFFLLAAFVTTCCIMLFISALQGSIGRDFTREEISLTAREFDLLYKLLSYPKKTFTRTQLMDEFWDVDTQTSTRTVDVYMTKLRAKLSECDSFEIQTVHGLGYKAVIK